MGPRFLAIVGTGRGACLPPAGLIPMAVGRPDIALFVEAGGAHVRLGPDGIILGTLFRSAPPALPVKALDDAVARTIDRTGGDALISDYWGAYIAILTAADQDRVRIIRDPSGFLPCYYGVSPGQVVIASDARLLVDSGLVGPEIDWTGLAGLIAADHIRPSATGLSAVQELLGGHRLTIRKGNVSISQLWSPWTFTDPELQIASIGEAAETLRDLTFGCIRSWAGLFDRILLAVSGGLDSSIVAAALRQADADYSCVTLATDDPAGDERGFARILTRSLGVQLFEAFESLADVDLTRSDSWDLPRPLSRSFAQSGDRIQSALAAELGADAFMSGAGGDNVFCYAHSVAPIADRLLQEGLGQGAWASVTDISRLTGCSRWMAARRAIHRAWMRSPDIRWPMRRRFLAPSVVTEGLAALAHPWLPSPRHAFPGKILHVSWLMAIQNHLEGFGRERIHPLLSPLMSQPMIELCLRIPSWLWCEGGRDRAVARRAFAPLLPKAIVERSSKGTPTSFVMQLFEANRDLIRDMLLDGRLASAGLLDRAALASFLDAPDPRDGDGHMAAMALVDAEAWARAWSGAQAAARSAG